jgi:hypothetical protein
LLVGIFNAMETYKPTLRSKRGGGIEEEKKGGWKGGQTYIHMKKKKKNLGLRSTL